MSNGYTRQKESAKAQAAKVKVEFGGGSKPHGNTRHVKNTEAPNGKAKVKY